MANATLDAILELIPDSFNGPDDDYLTARATMKPMHGHPIAGSSTLEILELGGVTASRLRAGAVAETAPVALFCHGGGFVSCPMSDYHFYAEHISRELGVQVVTPDYRLAPETRFPGALEDCVAVYGGLLAAGYAPSSLFLIGDSCGGALALCSLIAARQQGLPMPACFVGLTAWLDLTASSEAHRQAFRDPFITPGWLRRRAADYLGDVDPRTPLASPVYADCEGLPPLLLQHGARDITRDDGRRMAAVARAAGVEVILEIEPDMVHGFHGLLESIPECKAAWRRAAEFVAARTGGSDMD